MFKKWMNGFTAVMAVMALLLWMAPALFGAALTQGRDTPSRPGEAVGLTMASNVIIYAGAMVAINTSGLAAPAADVAGYGVVGRAEETVDNRGVLYSATKPIAVSRGIFRWVNGDAATDADIGKLAYVTDDQTVNKTGGGQNIIAGSILDVDTAGVWVDTSRIGPIGATTPTSLAVSGNGTVAGTLAVAGRSSLTNTAVTGGLTVTGTVAVVGSQTVSTSLTANQLWLGTNGYFVMLSATNLGWVTGSGAVTNSMKTW
jgi:hypothetical protein